eukprot:TRINITY_DN12648_c0_g4_i1.p1 TRINITY_DN12648_c0_g4~~TRINITY_DN12648_c0_g4_i1.p1  ORF type:complete len:589 (-),score=57.22 TRINITY_DN12648_c0_g4_i1:111-1877(-)
MRPLPTDRAVTRRIRCRSEVRFFYLFFRFFYSLFGVGVMLRAIRRSTGAVVSTTICAGGALYIFDRDAFDTARRSQRAAWLAARMLVDYQWSLHGLHEGDARQDVLKACHRRNAKLMKDTLFRNRGIYIKLGQIIGLADHILPDEYVDELAGCFDACPHSSFADVEAVFMEDFGKRPQDMFSDFALEPIASASLAQVHRATLPSGKKLAVKVQHRPLLRLLRPELAGIDFILRCVRYLEPRFDFQWFADEVKDNLPKELDFRLEAQNSAKCNSILKAGGLRGSVIVPDTYPDMTTKRVLVMDFEEGQSLSSPAADMQAAGVPPVLIVQRFAEMYAELTFGRGFLHCDPHPGNVLWRPAPEASCGFQLVLLDHGLYRELSEELRLTYCRLWHSLALGDVDATLAATRSLGVRSEWLRDQLAREGSQGAGYRSAYTGDKDDAETLAGKMLAAMLTGRPFRAIADTKGGLARFDRGHRGVSAMEDKAELGFYLTRYYHGILEVIRTLPRAMVLALKANDCLRATASRLGVPPSLPLAVSCRSCCRALRAAGDARGNSWKSWALDFRCWLFLALQTMSLRMTWRRSASTLQS